MDVTCREYQISLFLMITSYLQSFLDAKAMRIIFVKLPFTMHFAFLFSIRRVTDIRSNIAWSSYMFPKVTLHNGNEYFAL